MYIFDIKQSPKITTKIFMKIQVQIILLCLLSYASAFGQLAKTQVLRVSAIANTDGTVTLHWPYENYTGNYDIYKRTSQQTQSWGTAPIATIAGNLNQYTDATFKKGEAFEYQIVKRKASTTDALGYIYAGNQSPEINQYPGIILLIDSNYRIPLVSELTQLMINLSKEGYIVYTAFAGRGEAVATVKTRIKALYQSATIKPTCLFIIGHVPVPYAGYFSSNSDTPPPDGHVEGSGNHTGAWPADVVYGIFDDVLTDNWVDCKTGSQSRHHNVVGDGKYDQSKLGAECVLEIGRVDMFNMPLFKKSDTVLVSEYLTRNNNWRNGIWKAQERALVDNNFGSLNLASTGYANFAALVGYTNTTDSLDYLTAQKNGSYLWSYGCGAGSYTSCSGIGTTSNFVNDSFQNVFTILAGSFFGDWDNQNNLLRAPLASKSLASFWGGIPKWYVHHMGLGERIGKGTRISQNNIDFYFSGKFNLSENSMHIALMGDPTLRQKSLPPVVSLQAVSENKIVKLNWPAVSEPGIGYAVYMVDTTYNIYYRLNETPLTTTSFNHDKNYVSGNYLYAVKTMKLETSGSGTYYNTGGAAFARVNHVNSTEENLALSLDVRVYPNPVQARESIKIDVQLSVAKPIQASVYSLDGKLILTQDFKEIHFGLNQLELNIAGQNPGIYFLKLDSGNSSYVHKLVIL